MMTQTSLSAAAPALLEGRPLRTLWAPTAPSGTCACCIPVASSEPSVNNRMIASPPLAPIHPRKPSAGCQPSITNRALACSLPIALLHPRKPLPFFPFWGFCRPPLRFAPTMRRSGIPEILIANLELEFRLTHRKLSPLKISNRKFLAISRIAVSRLSDFVFAAPHSPLLTHSTLSNLRYRD